MAQVKIANSNAIRAQSNIIGQAFNDTEAHLSNHLTLIQQMQKQIDDLKKLVGAK